MKYTKLLRVMVMMGVDALSLLGVLGVAYVIRLGLGGWLEPLTTPWSYYAVHGVWMSALLILIAGYEGLYTQRRIFIEEARVMVRMITLWALVSVSILALTREIDTFSRIIFGTLFILLLVVIPLLHYGLKRLLMGWFRVSTLIIGRGESALEIADAIRTQSYLGYEIIGHIDDTPSQGALGTLEQMEEVIRSHAIRCVIVALPHLSTEALTPIINRAHHHVRHIMVIPNIKGVSLTNTKIHYFFEQQSFMLQLTNNLDSHLNALLKWSFDKIVSILLLPLLLPLIALIGLAIKLESPGPVFFAHPRVGKHGRTVPTLKFRSMFRDSKERLEKILATDPQARAEWEENYKLKEDPRITKVGAFLRKTSLDELPQILNVLKGEMSLVGPRPVLQEEIDKYYGEGADYYYMVLPGITGLWQVSGRSETSYEYRVAIDTWYVLNWSLWLDIVILFKTVKVVLKREGAY